MPPGSKAAAAGARAAVRAEVAAVRGGVACGARTLPRLTTPPHGVWEAQQPVRNALHPGNTAPSLRSAQAAPERSLSM